VHPAVAAVLLAGAVAAAAVTVLAVSRPADEVTETVVYVLLAAAGPWILYAVATGHVAVAAVAVAALAVLAGLLWRRALR
jgi:hypothetical protein